MDREQWLNHQLHRIHSSNTFSIHTLKAVFLTHIHKHTKHHTNTWQWVIGCYKGVNLWSQWLNYNYKADCSRRRVVYCLLIIHNKIFNRNEIKFDYISHCLPFYKGNKATIMVKFYNVPIEFAFKMPFLYWIHKCSRRNCSHCSQWIDRFE